MTIDPLFFDLLIKFVLPLLTIASAVYITASRRRPPHPLLLAVIGRLVYKDVFDADDLVEIGVLKLIQDDDQNPMFELAKMLRSG